MYVCAEPKVNLQQFFFYLPEYVRTRQKGTVREDAKQTSCSQYRTIIAFLSQKLKI